MRPVLLLPQLFYCIFVNLRHLLMSPRLAPYFMKLPLFKNLLIGSQITDETFGVAVQRCAAKRIFRRKMDDWAKCNGLFKLDSCYYYRRVIGEWIPIHIHMDGLCITSNVYRIICTSAHK